VTTFTVGAEALAELPDAVRLKLITHVRGFINRGVVDYVRGRRDLAWLETEIRDLRQQLIVLKTQAGKDKAAQASTTPPAAAALMAQHNERQRRREAEEMERSAIEAAALKRLAKEWIGVEIDPANGYHSAAGAEGATWVYHVSPIYGTADGWLTVVLHHAILNRPLRTTIVRAEDGAGLIEKMQAELDAIIDAAEASGQPQRKPRKPRRHHAAVPTLPN
jgi:hypothetical protein